MPSPLLAVRVQRRDLWVALASFCIVGAVLVRVLSAPLIARTWPVGTETITMVATGGLAVVPGTDLEARRADLVRTTTVRQLGAGFVPRGTTAYQISVDTRGADDVVVARERRVVTQLEPDGTAVATPVNRAEGEEFNASGDAVLKNRPLDRIAGQVLRFPPDTPTVDRMLWDPETGRAWPASYEGSTTRSGRRTLEFRQRVPAVTVPDPDGAGGTSTVSVDRTVWVRPEIGAIVDERLQIERTRHVGGTERVLLGADFRTRPADVTAAGSRVDDVVRQSTWLLVVGPAVLLLLGMLAVAAAVVSTVRRSASSTTKTEEQR